MPAVLRIIQDLLKPYKPEIVTFSKQVAETKGVSEINAMFVVIHKIMGGAKLTIKGDNIGLEPVEDLGGSTHSVDEVVCGDRLVKESRTPQGFHS